MSYSDQTSTRDFLTQQSLRLNKDPSHVEKYINILEEHWISNVAAIK